MTNFKNALNISGGFFDVATKKNELAALEEKMSAPDFWDHKEQAQETINETNTLRNVLTPFMEISSEVEDFEVLVELIAESKDEDMLAEADDMYKEACANLDKLELMSFLSGKMDKNNAIITIKPGAGGTESCDWSSMLMRMYLHWFDNKGFKSEVLEVMPGEEAGIKTATIMVSGEFAFGYLRGEVGVHRLVRISPFDANKRRHTSFCAVDVVPEIDDDIDIEVNEVDLKIDTYRASGAGGQHVNTTDSAVRITHTPSGVVVACQNERSQHKNRATAMKILKARLYELEERKRQQEQQALHGEKKENAWGSQIRSYVLQPYQMVTDMRTGVKSSNAQGVLDGDLDQFVEAYLRGEKREDKLKESEE